ncbi:ABC transporter permease subunit [Sporosalibacterium faouarense]|uniref:ABC transporter permease subunit n=1 Tax=Sporosalibacterium faouarense TaxID=516123 RepID=UPI00141D3CCE|nr:ABC transporter permease subunit [Sporosalibacterium faouarense]MTI46304.1 ABC transporter permease [Bacillota bacterium]
MNGALFLSTLKSKYKFMLVCSAALVMYSIIIISMFDPSNAESSKVFMEMMPDNFIKAFGFTIVEPGLTSFLGTTMYSMPYMIFMIIFSLITANSLIAKNVTRGSMACYLSTPVSRTKVALTNASILILGQIIMAFLLTVFSILFSIILFGNSALDIPSFIKVNIMGLILFFVIGSYSFLFSCIFNDEKYSISISVGLTLLFYAMNTIGNLSDSLSWLNKLNIFGAFIPAKIINNTSNIFPLSIIFIIGGILIYGLSAFIFNRRNLPL